MRRKLSLRKSVTSKKSYWSRPAYFRRRHVPIRQSVMATGSDSPIKRIGVQIIVANSVSRIQIAANYQRPLLTLSLIRLARRTAAIFRKGAERINCLRKPTARSLE